METERSKNMFRKMLALLLVCCSIFVFSTASATTYLKVKYDKTYPDTGYSIVDGSLSAGWNEKTVTNPPSPQNGFGAYGACQYQSTLSSSKTVTAIISVRKSGSSSNLGSVTIATTVPANGTSSIIENWQGGNGFSLISGVKYKYYVVSNAPSGVRGIYQGGVHDFDG